MLHAGMTPAELCGALAEGQDPAAMDAAVARIQDLQAFLKAFRGSMDLRVQAGAGLPVVTAWQPHDGSHDEGMAT